MAVAMASSMDCVGAGSVDGSVVDCLDSDKPGGIGWLRRRCQHWRRYGSYCGRWHGG